jgi:hypothetical protein
MDKGYGTDQDSGFRIQELEPADFRALPEQAFSITIVRLLPTMLIRNQDSRVQTF